MERPDFKEINRITLMLRDMEAAFECIFSGTEKLEEDVKDGCLAMLKDTAADSLKEIPVSELKNARAGIRTGLLEEAGYHTLYDLYAVDDHRIRAISGIGEKQAAAIRTVIDEFLKNLASRGHIILRAEETDGRSADLILKIAKFRKAFAVRREAEGMREDVHALLAERIAAVKITNRLKWIFSSGRAKEETFYAAQALKAAVNEPLLLRAGNLLTVFAEVPKTGKDSALKDFEKNGAAYYALLEKYAGTGAAEAFVYSSVPAQLAAEISAEALDTDGFKGTLRAYQEFGAKYVLHQKRVLLGDEMGLGKTIQAIAVMADLEAKAPGSHFLVVCPASVMINWCRETEKFSNIKAFLVHGALWESRFEEWKRLGGTAVTSYEGMDRIAWRINNAMKLGLFVVDEAHYIKKSRSQTHEEYPYAR